MASGFRRRRRVTAKQRLAKIMERAEKILGEGDVYEASQSFKALVPRYVKDDKFSDAADLLREGCLKMLKHKEFRCALDLSTDLLGLSKDANDDAKVNEIVLESLSKVLEKFPDSSEKDRLLTDSINWSKNAKLKQSSNGAGSPLLHAIAAKACVKSGNVRLAFKHFLYAQSARDFAKLVCSQISKGHTSEYDLFVLRTVLSYLCAGAEVKEAELLLREIETRAKRNAKDFPLLRFLNRLFVLIPQGDDADELFHLLVQVYAPGFSSRDPSIYKLIKTIDIKFFGGVPPTSAAASRSPFGGGNMMNMMRMMMGK